jgi:hypothetical protein
MVTECGLWSVIVFKLNSFNLSIEILAGDLPEPLKAIGADFEPLLNKAKQSPPIPVSVGSITANTAAAEIAASIALPPCFIIVIAVSEASGCDVATIALLE